jgi:hypothetical protein
MHIQTHKHQGDHMSLLLFSQNRESILKISLRDTGYEDVVRRNLLPPPPPILGETVSHAGMCDQ